MLLLSILSAFANFALLINDLYVLWSVSILLRVRTSSGMFLQRGRDKVIRAIEKRIADYTFIPAGM
jgi:hypothetical protein